MMPPIEYPHPSLDPMAAHRCVLREISSCNRIMSSSYMTGSYDMTHIVQNQMPMPAMGAQYQPLTATHMPAHLSTHHQQQDHPLTVAAGDTHSDCKVSSLVVSPARCAISPPARKTFEYHNRRAWRESVL